MILKRFQMIFTIFEIVFTCSSDLTCGSTTSPKDLKSLTSSISSFFDLILKSLCELCFTTFPDRDTHSKLSFFSVLNSVKDDYIPASVGHHPNIPVEFLPPGQVT